MQHGESSDSGKIAIKISHFEADQVLTVMNGHLPSQGWSPTFPKMVTNLRQDGHPPSPGWSPTISNIVTHQGVLETDLKLFVDIGKSSVTFFYCQAQPQLQLQLSWAGFALLPSSAQAQAQAQAGG